MILTVEPVVRKIIQNLTDYPQIPGITKGFPAHDICSYAIDNRIKKFINKGEYQYGRDGLGQGR